MTLLFDIGGTNMRVTLALEDGIGPVMIGDTPQSPEEAVQRLHELARGLSLPYDGAVGGVAGTVLPDGRLAEAGNLVTWNSVDIHRLFSETLAVPVTLYNDAQLNALGEATHGAGMGAHRLAYLGFGTGIGTCLVVEGEIEASTSGGEERRRVVRLRDGSLLDSIVSGGAIRARTGQAPESLSRAEWEQFTPLAAEGIENAIEAWSPDRVVVAGSLIDDEDGLRISELRALLPEHHQHLLVAGTLRDTSGLWGAWEKAV